ncbi:MAG: protease HtpX [Gammaproteobacteria bacterium]|nr:MAG: protease HtpX [Gammaproteobacteria bacterium]
MQRIVLFAITNIAVLLVISLTFSLFGLDRYMAQQGMNMPMLLVFAALFGMGGSMISLLLSKTMAKRMTRARVIDQPGTADERWLVETVARQAALAGIDMPEVAVYPAPEMNAFATGANRNKALVAVSEGIFRQMSRDELEAVLAHEISHVGNGDMVTMALLQGVLNTFVIFFARIVAQIASSAGSRDGGRGGNFMIYFAVNMAAQVLFGILASVVASWFSRKREFRADAGAANLAGRDKMVAALRRLQSGEPAQLPEQLDAMGISASVTSGLASLLHSHPPLEARIDALLERP